MGNTNSSKCYDVLFSNNNKCKYSILKQRKYIFLVNRNISR